MHFRTHRPDDVAGLTRLVTRVFHDAAGEAEGGLIGALAEQLLTTTPEEDLLVFLAGEDAELRAAVFATRMPTEAIPETFLIAPVAVATPHQGRGLGQALLSHSIQALRELGARVLVTYGDPAFYGRVGFAPVSVEQIVPPYPLTQPEGWLAQTAGGTALQETLGRATCVPAFQNPAYW
jgi:predicted N-acetyltransferase YhbS